MIQDIAPMKFHNEYQQRECRDKDIVFLFSGNKLLVKKDSKISFFYMKEFTNELTKETEQEADGFGNKRLQYLFLHPFIMQCRRPESNRYCVTTTGF